jgi:predicted nucleic acid-binding protein
MRQGAPVFVDSGAWIALALTRDPLHARARELWELALGNGARLFTSLPVVLETFTFLDRNANREVALEWKESLTSLANFKILACTLHDLDRSWSFFTLRGLHKVSAVDATSFAIMTRMRIRIALTFDHHFAAVGFRSVG